jgi:cyclic-di-GMP phosphodiesterase TipF (flagellum assembly factor)
MSRLAAIFVVACMVLIAASFGAVLYLLAGLAPLASAVAAIAALVVLAIYQVLTARSRDRAALGSQIADLSRGAADLARQVAELSRRTAAIEAQGDRIADGAAEKARVMTEPITLELGELGSLVKQLAETVALHELKFAQGFGAGRRHDDRPSPQPSAPPVAAPRAAASEPLPPAADEREQERGASIETVREAINANRIDLYLQPIVTLPQRKVRYYEGFSRLRSKDGDLLQPSDFLAPAESGGLMPRIDHLLLFRCVQVVRRLQLKNRDIGLFCNIAASTLNDLQLFPQILQFMDANRALAPALVLEFKQSLLRSMGPLETESLAALRELGFRFCMDHVTDLRMEPRDLGERGVRYVKIPAPLLLGQASAPRADIHAADLSDLLGRYGISLIAEKIEAEAQVVDLLEYDVRFGQGFLFSQPRPVREEALRGGSDAETSAGGRDNVAAGGPAGLAL